MVEVFKTNVNDPRQAEELLGTIHRQFKDYRATLDLEDCDKILRVTSHCTFVPETLIHVVRQSGFECIILPDE